RLRLNWGLRRASRYLWRLARKVSGSGVRACEHCTAGRRLSSTWITKQSWMAISVTFSMRLSLRKRREDVTNAPCVAGGSPGRQAALHYSRAHECSTPGRQAELQICSAGAERPGKSRTIPEKQKLGRLNWVTRECAHSKGTFSSKNRHYSNCQLEMLFC